MTEFGTSRTRRGKYGMRARCFVFFGLLATWAGHAQTFDAASVKPNKAGNSGGEGSTRESISYDPGALRMRNVTLKSCIRWAYGVASYQISGPAWMDSQRYDIQARTGTPAMPEQLRLMLRELMAARFHLTLHRETRELPVYDLIAAKGGPKLMPTEGDGQGEMRPVDGDLVYRHYSMMEFSESLPGMPFRVNRTVIDKTGLQGAYDFRLKISSSAAEMKSSFEHSDGPLIIDVLQQIGLTLQPRKGPVEVLVIDRAEKNAEEN